LERYRIAFKRDREPGPEKQEFMLLAYSNSMFFLKAQSQYKKMKTNQSVIYEKKRKNDQRNHTEAQNLRKSFGGLIAGG
jgi:hypothetical protein